MKSKTTIILADDHEPVRRSLRAILEQQKGLEVVGEVGDGQAAIEMARDVNPDVILMDVRMPILNGIEATRRIKSELPEVKIIAVSMFSDWSFVREMREAGASGYVLKSSAQPEVVAAIHALDDDVFYICPQIKRALGEKEL